MLPPVAAGWALVLGLLVSRFLGGPLPTSPVTAGLGWLLVAAFVVWNGWALLTIARHRTALLPGEATTVVIDHGPFAWSRNPLYIGLLAGSAGVGLVAGVGGGGGGPPRGGIGVGAGCATPGVGAAPVGRGRARGAVPGREVRGGVRRLHRPGPALD